MARRAGVVPFSLAASNTEGTQQSSQSARVQSDASTQTGSSARMGHLPPGAIIHGGSMVGPRRDTFPASISPQAYSMPISEGIPDLGVDVYRDLSPGLAPIQTPSRPCDRAMLPGIAELTAGVSPYNAPTGPLNIAMPGVQSAPESYFPPTEYPGVEHPRSKRRASPRDVGRKHTG